MKIPDFPPQVQAPSSASTIPSPGGGTGPSAAGTTCHPWSTQPTQAPTFDPVLSTVIDRLIVIEDALLAIEAHQEAIVDEFLALKQLIEGTLP